MGLGAKMSGGWCVILNHHLAFVIQVTFEYVRFVTNVNFTRSRIKGQCLSGQFIVRSTLVPPGG